MIVFRDFCTSYQFVYSNFFFLNFDVINLLDLGNKNMGLGLWFKLKYPCITRMCITFMVLIMTYYSEHQKQLPYIVVCLFLRSSLSTCMSTGLFVHSIHKIFI